jgi:hypothetical protein
MLNTAFAVISAARGIIFTEGSGGGGPGWKCRHTPALKQNRLEAISNVPLARTSHSRHIVQRARTDASV